MKTRDFPWAKALTTQINKIIKEVRKLISLINIVKFILTDEDRKDSNLFLNAHSAFQWMSVNVPWPD